MLPGYVCASYPTPSLKLNKSMQTIVNVGLMQRCGPDDLSRERLPGTLRLIGPRNEPTIFHGGVNLSGSKVSRIIDGVKSEIINGAKNETRRRDPDASSAGAGVNPAFLQLDGLTYDRFGDPTDVLASARIASLDLQQPKDLYEAFKPQPWEQMIKVLRDMGHYKEARSVAIEKQVRLREKPARSQGRGFGTSSTAGSADTDIGPIS